MAAPVEARVRVPVFRMDVERAQDWLDRYVAAWLSYDPRAIGALFSDDVAYRYHPYDEPVLGRDAVVASWLGEEADGTASDRDEPGTYEASYTPLTVDGDIVVATGTSRFRDEPGGPITQIYESCLLLRFDDAGQCRELIEYYIKRP
jgi:hypothetical protein